MISKLRGFSNSKLAGVLVGIIIIPFVFWGMGSVFSGGNTNNVAKINNEVISSKDFINFINESRLTNDIIKANIDKNIIENISQKLNKDPAEIRKLNFIEPEEFPFETALGMKYDSGEYKKILSLATKRANWNTFAERREESEKRGMLRGIGMSYYIEACGGGPTEFKTIAIFSKKARGMMTRLIIDNNISDISDIKSFDYDGYMFHKELSTDKELIFTR